MMTGARRGSRLGALGLWLAVLSLLAQVAFGPAVANPAPQDPLATLDGFAICRSGVPGAPAPPAHPHHGVPCSLCPACAALWTAPMLPVSAVALPGPTMTASLVTPARPPPCQAPFAPLASFFPTGPPVVS